VRGEASSQGLVSRREDTPPKSGAEHLGKMSLTDISRGRRQIGRRARGKMLTDGVVWSTIDALSGEVKEGQRGPDELLRARIFGNGMAQVDERVVQNRLGLDVQDFCVELCGCWKLWALVLVGASAADLLHNRPCLCTSNISNRRERLLDWTWRDATWALQ
jgi:hypothetical protein